jgi:hypothetical protein
LFNWKGKWEKQALREAVKMNPLTAKAPDNQIETEVKD